jgi:hypothetical protein
MEPVGQQIQLSHRSLNPWKLRGESPISILPQPSLHPNFQPRQKAKATSLNLERTFVSKQSCGWEKSQPTKQSKVSAVAPVAQQSEGSKHASIHSRLGYRAEMPPGKLPLLFQRSRALSCLKPCMSILLRITHSFLVQTTILQNLNTIQESTYKDFFKFYLFKLIVVLVLLSGLSSSAQSVVAEKDRKPSMDLTATVAIVLTVSPEMQEWPALLKIADNHLSRRSYFLLRIKNAAVESIGECNTEMSCKLLLARSPVPANSVDEVKAWIDSTIISTALEMPLLLVVDRSMSLNTKVYPSSSIATRMRLGRFSDVIHLTREVRKQSSNQPPPIDLAPIQAAKKFSAEDTVGFPGQLSAIDITASTPFVSNTNRPFKYQIDRDSKGQSSSSDLALQPTLPGVPQCTISALLSGSATVSTDSKRSGSFEQLLACYNSKLIGQDELTMISQQWFEEKKDSQIIGLAIELSRKKPSLGTALAILYTTVLSGKNLCPGQSLVKSLFELSGSPTLDPKTAATFAHCSQNTSNDSTPSPPSLPISAVPATALVSSKNDRTPSLDRASESTGRVKAASLAWVHQTSVTLTFIGDMSLLLTDIAPKCKTCSSVVEDIAFHSVHTRSSLGDKEFLSDLITVQIALLTAKELGFLTYDNSARESGMARNSDQLCRASSFWDSILCSRGANSELAKVRFKQTLFLLLGKNPEELISSMAEKGHMVVQLKEYSVSIKTALLNRLIGTLSMAGYSKERRLLEVLNSDARSSLMVLISGRVPLGGIDSIADLLLDAEDLSLALAQFMDNSHLSVMNWLLSVSRRDIGSIESLFRRTQTPCSFERRNVFKCLLKLPLDAQRKLWVTVHHDYEPNDSSLKLVDSKGSESGKESFDNASPYLKMVRLEFQTCIQEWTANTSTAEEKVFRNNALEAYEAVLRTLSPASFVLLKKIIRLSAYDGCADKRIFRALQLISMNDWRRVDVAAFAVVMLSKLDDELTMNALDSILAKLISLTELQVGELIKTLACAHCGAFVESERRDLSAFFIETLDNLPEKDAGYRVDLMSFLSRVFGRRRGAGISSVVTSCMRAHSWGSIWLDELLVVDIDKSVKGLSHLASQVVSHPILLDGRIGNTSIPESFRDQSIQALGTVNRETSSPSELDLETLTKIFDLEVISDGKTMAQRHESIAFADLAVAGARNLQGARYWIDSDYAYNGGMLPFSLELLQWRCLQSKDVEQISVGLLLQSFRSNVRSGSEAGAENPLHQNPIARYWIAHLKSIAMVASEDAVFKLLSFLIWRKE